MCEVSHEQVKASILIRSYGPNVALIVAKEVAEELRCCHSNDNRSKFWKKVKDIIENWNQPKKPE